MCGRFSITISLDQIIERFGCIPENIEFAPRFNVAPTQQIPVIVEGERHRELRKMRWGLIPFWAKDMSMGQRLINARAETVAEKPAFKNSLARRRCIIPADGYYEWIKTPQGKIPMRIVPENGGAFGMAGLWDAWADPEGNMINSFTIITTEPVEPIRYIHDRMPLILDREAEAQWLKGPGETKPAALAEFLSSVKREQHLEAYQVSSLVNSPANDRPEVIEKV